VIRRVQKEHKPRRRTRGHVRGDAKLALVVGDAEKIRTIVDNLSRRQAFAASGVIASISFSTTVRGAR
jgi:hypothetical protein